MEVSIAFYSPIVSFLSRLYGVEEALEEVTEYGLFLSRLYGVEERQGAIGTVHLFLSRLYGVEVCRPTLAEYQ